MADEQADSLPLFAAALAKRIGETKIAAAQLMAGHRGHNILRLECVDNDFGFTVLAEVVRDANLLLVPGLMDGCLTAINERKVQHGA